MFLFPLVQTKLHITQLQLVDISLWIQILSERSRKISGPPLSWGNHIHVFYLKKGFYQKHTRINNWNQRVGNENLEKVKSILSVLDKI